MKKKAFLQAAFILSSDGTNVPKAPFPHLVIVGKSNVGKSSFINALLQEKGLAKVSQVPGKTQLVNFFLIDESFYLVDLPGYGYSKVSKKEKEAFAKRIETYIAAHLDKITFVQLIDSRHGPTKEDKQFMDWAESLGKNIVYVFTKIDKIKKTARKGRIGMFLPQMGHAKHILPFSIHEAMYRDEFIELINMVMKV